MKIRLIGAAIVAAVLPAVAGAAQINPTLRVEGQSTNVVPLMPFAVQNSATALVTVDDTIDTDTIRVSARSATAQVAGAASWLGLSLGFDIFNFGGPSSFITQIGPDRMPVSFSPSWRLKVNHKGAPTGSDATDLKATDSVLWSFGASFDEPELDLRVAKQHLARGRTFQARVVAFDNDGVATPGAGASVRFAGRAKTADAMGSATFRATRDGAFWVSATRTGSVRSQRQLVCVHPVTTGKLCSAVTFPAAAGRVTGPRAITGIVAGVLPNSRVNVALAKLVGSKCRFLRANRRTFSAPRSCNNPLTVPVVVNARGAWILRIASARLTSGRYRVSSRMTAGTRRETRATPGINSLSFTLVRPGLYL